MSAPRRPPLARRTTAISSRYANSASRSTPTRPGISPISRRSWNLSADQKALWDKWQQASIAGADKLRTQCVAQAPESGARLNALQKEAFAESMLTLEVDSLKSARPALEALYAALTPEQRALFDHRGGEHRRRWPGHDSERGGHGVL